MRGLLLALAVLAGLARGAIIGREYWLYVGPTTSTTDDYPYNWHFDLDGADPGEAPLVAYTEYYNTARVLRFNGTSWNKVGKDGVANGTLFDVRIAGHPTLAGRPYVAYADRPLFNPDDELDDNPDTISVKWWNGSQWQHVAPYQPAATTAADIDFGMAFHVSDAWGQLVCYIDRATYGLACKQPYRGRWRLLGSAGFTGSSVSGPSLAVGSTPYIAFDDAKLTRRGRVMRYAAVSKKWQNFGPSFSARAARMISLAINPKTGAPWVAFVGDPAGTKLAPLDSKKLTVMAWNGTAWRTRAHGAFGDGTLHTSLAFNANGTPFVAFNCEPLFRRLCVRAYINGSWFDDLLPHCSC